MVESYPKTLGQVDSPPKREAVVFIFGYKGGRTTTLKMAECRMSHHAAVQNRFK